MNTSSRISGVALIILAAVLVSFGRTLGGATYSVCSFIGGPMFLLGLFIAYANEVDIEHSRTEAEALRRRVENLERLLAERR